MRCLAGRSGSSIRHRPAAQHALQERGGFGEPPGAGEAGRLEHVGVQYVVHVRSFLGLCDRSQARARQLVRLAVEKVVGKIWVSGGGAVGSARHRRGEPVT